MPRHGPPELVGREGASFRVFQQDEATAGVSVSEPGGRVVLVNGDEARDFDGDEFVSVAFGNVFEGDYEGCVAEVVTKGE